MKIKDPLDWSPMTLRMPLNIGLLKCLVTQWQTESRKQKAVLPSSAAGSGVRTQKRLVGKQGPYTALVH